VNGRAISAEHFGEHSDIPASPSLDPVGVPVLHGAETVAAAFTIDSFSSCGKR
jgi:hypothetical protein